jgi:hypothetical protein
VLLSGCVTRQVENVTLIPPAGESSTPAIIREGDLERVLRIVDEVASQFEFERVEHTGRGNLGKINTAIEYMGIELLVEYEHQSTPSPTYIRLTVHLALSRSDATVTVSTRGGRRAGEFLVEVRDEVVRRLRGEFPAWRTDVESKTVETSLAP